MSFRQSRPGHPSSHPGKKTGTLADPVCGMTVAPDSPHHLEHGGTTYRFCSAQCRAKFRGKRESYHSEEDEETSSADQPAPPGTVYVCPMDPKVRRDGPGACPRCGMALEPEMLAMPATRTESNTGGKPTGSERRTA